MTRKERIRAYGYSLVHGLCWGFIYLMAIMLLASMATDGPDYLGP